MALVVLLTGVNVGVHRTFRPSVMAKELKLDVTSIGAAGTFVVRQPISRTKLREDIMRRLPFAADVMICGGWNTILRIAKALEETGLQSRRRLIDGDRSARSIRRRHA
jgi:hypothetical protein